MDDFTANILPKPKFMKARFSFDLSHLYKKFVHNLTRFVYRPTYIGLENIPKTGGAILISNHVSYVDGPIIDAGIYAYCGRHVRYVIDEDIYNLPVVHYLMKLARAIPIASNRKSVEEALISSSSSSSLFRAAFSAASSK